VDRNRKEDARKTPKAMQAALLQQGRHASEPTYGAFWFFLVSLVACERRLNPQQVTSCGSKLQGGALAMSWSKVFDFDG
jgi:hypothetical protein